MPGDALMRYTVPMPDDSLIPGRATEKVALNGSVLSTVHDGGRGRNRTAIVGHSCTLARSPLVTDPDSDRGRQPWAGRLGAADPR